MAVIEECTDEVRPASQRRPTVHIVDPGFIVPVGHHQEVNRLLIEHCDREGLDCRVLAERRCDPAILAERRGIGVFQHHMYFWPPDDLETIRYAGETNLAAEAILDEHVSPHLRPGDTVLCHTISHLYLIGLIRWFAKLTVPGVRLRLVLRFPPSFQCAPTNRQAAETLFRYGLERWAAHSGDAVLFADTPNLQRYYHDLAGVETRLVPVSIDFDQRHPPMATSEAPSGAPHFLFVGDGRPEKGFDLLPAAIEHFRESGGDGRFTIQCWGGAHETRAQLEALGDAVTLVDKPLVGEAYDRFLASGDAVLVPYSPDAYHLRTSHILVEALGCGLPVITTAGTWMADELVRFDADAGVLATRFDATAIAEAMLAFGSDRDRVSTKARAIAGDVRATHNAHTFCETLLAG